MECRSSVDRAGSLLRSHCRHYRPPEESAESAAAEDLLPAEDHTVRWHRCIRSHIRHADERNGSRRRPRAADCGKRRGWWTIRRMGGRCPQLPAAEAVGDEVDVVVRRCRDSWNEHGTDVVCAAAAAAAAAAAGRRVVLRWKESSSLAVVLRE